MEFNLSEEMHKCSTILDGEPQMFAFDTNIKEFIKRETKLIQLWMREKITAKEFWERRRKLVGDKLK